MKRILLPFAWIYNLVTRFRNHLYNIGYRRSVRFDGVFVIGVGNLNMGGSGKTPIAEYLVRLLKDRWAVATLSRGYGRITSGFRILSDEDTHLTVGDEPLQMHRKFKGHVKVAVAEDRALAIPNLLQDEPVPDVVILDDAFQHRRVMPDLNILLTRFDQPFHRDKIFPVGWLREARVGARRADAVVFTKSPLQLSERDRDMHSKAARIYAGDVPVFFTSHRYGMPEPFGSARGCTQRIVLVTGIAQSAFLADRLPHGLVLERHFRYPDHHPFESAEVESINNYARKTGLSILTTEKDMVRLMALPDQRLIQENPWFYLPVEIVFPQGGEDFDKLVLQKIEEKRASSDSSY